MDMLFKQFRVRTSFEDSRGIKKKEEKIEKGEEISLITDLNGLKKFEEGLGKRADMGLVKDKKRFISDFFGDDGNDNKSFMKR